MELGTKSCIIFKGISKLNNVGVFERSFMEVFYVLELNFFEISLELGYIPYVLYRSAKDSLLSRCIPLADGNISTLKVHISMAGI